MILLENSINLAIIDMPINSPARTNKGIANNGYESIDLNSRCGKKYVISTPAYTPTKYIRPLIPNEKATGIPSIRNTKKAINIIQIILFPPHLVVLKMKGNNMVS